MNTIDLPTRPTRKMNSLFIEVAGSGLPEVDGLFVPSTAPPTVSESGVASEIGYWNGKPAWDRADGKSARSPALSYSNSYQSWRISRLDGHLAYHTTGDDALPPTDREWDVYKMGVAPAPSVTIHHCDLRLPCPTAHVIFVLGGPGAGKGTMCELAAEQLGWVHLSMGDLLRTEQEAGGPNASELAEAMHSGGLAPDAILMGLLRSTMERIIRGTGKRNFLLDGFPRSLSNLTAWIGAFGEEMELPKMLYFECPLEELRRRILSRAPFTGRADDNLESLQSRFETFRAKTLPIVDRFKSEGKCVEVDTSQDRPTIYEILRQHLAEFTDPALAERPFSERSEILLGLRPYPRQA